MNKTELVLLC